MKFCSNKNLKIISQCPCYPCNNQATLNRTSSILKVGQQKKKKKKKKKIREILCCPQTDPSQKLNSKLQVGEAIFNSSIDALLEVALRGHYTLLLSNFVLDITFKQIH